jgi:hypothetical protein
MAITNAQQYQQLVNKPANGKRPGYKGPGGYQSGQSDPSTGATGNIGGGGAPSPGDTGGEGGYNPSDNSTTQFGGGANNTGPYDDTAAKKQKEKEKRAEEARKQKAADDKKAAEAEAKQEKRKARAKAKKDKRLKKMRQKAFDRFQQLEPYVNIMDDYGETGEDLAKATGFKGNIETGFEYDKDFFRDSKTGKIKDQFTEMVDINKGKTDIFGNPKEPKFVEQFKSDAIPGYDFSINPVKSNFQSGLGTLTSTGSTTKVRPNDYGIQIPTGTSLDILSGIVRPETGLQAFNTLEEARNIGGLTSRYAGGDDSAYDEYLDLIDRTNPTTGGGGGGGQQQDPCLGPNPPAYCNVNNTTDPADPKQILSTRILGSQFDPTFFANEGGRAELAGGGMPYEGGIMDLESGRQMYFLGKLVKKAKRAVKKLTKSKIGKAALLGAVGYGLGGGTFFGKMLPGVTRGGQGFGGFGGLDAIFGNVGDMIGGTSLGDKFAKFGGSKFMKYAGLPTIASYLMTPKEDDFDIDAYYAANQLTPGTTKRQMGSEFDFYNYNLAEGGMPSKEPVAKKTMPLIDMDGKEMDLRAEGGFVPIGRMEKADDVPARLSKNEFVFTADAVRNAGDGDVDKGAEVMYNMMKNLESGGDVSEESQGLEGAREMFQTSQRLEEVI